MEIWRGKPVWQPPLVWAYEWVAVLSCTRACCYCCIDCSCCPALALARPPAGVHVERRCGKPVWQLPLCGLDRAVDAVLAAFWLLCWSFVPSRWFSSFSCNYWRSVNSAIVDLPETNNNNNHKVHHILCCVGWGLHRPRLTNWLPVIFVGFVVCCCNWLILFFFMDLLPLDSFEYGTLLRFLVCQMHCEVLFRNFKDGCRM